MRNRAAEVAAAAVAATTPATTITTITITTTATNTTTAANNNEDDDDDNDQCELPEHPSFSCFTAAVTASVGYNTIHHSPQLYDESRATELSHATRKDEYLPGNKFIQLAADVLYFVFRF